MIRFTTREWNHTSKIICTFSVISMLMACALVIHRLHSLSNAVVAKATISKVIESHSDELNPRYSSVHVFADPHGRVVKAVSSESTRPPTAVVGDQVEILYPSHDLKSAIRHDFLGKWGLASIIGSLGFAYFLIFAVVAHVTDKKLRQQPQRHAA